MDKKYDNLAASNFRVNIDDYSPNIQWLAENFFYTCERLNIPWKNRDYRDTIRQACHVFFLLNKNILPSKPLSKVDLMEIELIVGEIKTIVQSLEKKDLNSSTIAIKKSDKLRLIYDFLENNLIFEKRGMMSQPLGKIFNDYRSLYLIINLINSSYDELLSKGFSTETILIPFVQVIHAKDLFGEVLIEEQKLQMFLDLINGIRSFCYDIKKINPAFASQSRTIRPINLSRLFLPETTIKYILTNKGSKNKIVKTES